MLILGLVGILQAWFGTQEDQHFRQVMLGLGLWALLAFLLPWLYAGRQVGDMAWMIVPLWALAAFEISHAFNIDEDRTAYIGWELVWRCSCACLPSLAGSISFPSGATR